MSSAIIAPAYIYTHDVGIRHVKICYKNLCCSFDSGLHCRSSQVGGRQGFTSLLAALNKLAKGGVHARSAWGPYDGDSNFFGQTG